METTRWREFTIITDINNLPNDHTNHYKTIIGKKVGKSDTKN